MNELTIKTTDLIKKIEQSGLENLTKPLQNEIFLSNVFVYGLAFNPPPALVTLKEGDEVTLQRKKKRYDEFSISVPTLSGKYLGEVNEFNNEILARLMDAGKKLTAKVNRVVISENKNILSISIFLGDF